jgi:hypothetical protein
MVESKGIRSRDKLEELSVVFHPGLDFAFLGLAG